MTPSYDVMILGGGPGGYVAAIRAAQLSLKAAVVEREHLGGVCLNWGCIPTKALLRNAEIARLVTGGGKEFGFTAENVTLDYAAAVERSRKISARLVKGVELLMQSHAIDVLWGVGRLTSPTTVEIAAKDGVQTLEAPHIILATGSRARLIPGVEADGETILTARHALERRELPASAVIIGAGPIGLEFATIWAAYGAQVTVVEMLEHLLPAEDEDAARELARALKRQKIKTLESTRVESLTRTAAGVAVRVIGPKGEATLEAEVALVAI
ncbi:MAG: FAD-dependent oxidoreductase, partial [Chloroflexi bacterium]|nr:FAD-dependent oxidoreductase [Chloroflexota bacterium]